MSDEPLGKRDCWNCIFSSGLGVMWYLVVTWDIGREEQNDTNFNLILLDIPHPIPMGTAIRSISSHNYLDVSLAVVIDGMTEQIALGAGFYGVCISKSEVKIWLDNDGLPVMVQSGLRFKRLFPLATEDNVSVYPIECVCRCMFYLIFLVISIVMA
jgi:hypothetical protein